MNGMDEKGLIEAVLGGDVASFRPLVERYQAPVYSFMLRATGSVMTAQDLTQDVFMRAYEKLHTFRREKRFFPWLYTIAVNRCRDFRRRKGIRRDLFVDGPDHWEPADPRAEDCVRRQDCVMAVQQMAAMVERLPLSISEPLLLFYREELSIREIAEILGITPAAVKTRIHRGRQQLKEMMGVHDETR